MSDAITANGLQIPTIETILSEMATSQRQLMDPNIDTDPDSPQGQANGIIAERERAIWEVLQVAYNGFNPDAAENFLLEGVCAITGTKRAESTASTVKVNINTDANKLIPAGTLFANEADNTIQFSLDSDYINTVAGISPLLPSTCTQFGPTICNATTLTVIVSPVSGLNSVNNPSDAVPGQLEDTDPILRVRRINELDAEGASTVDSIRSAILRIRLDDDSAPVLDCVVIENTSDYPSSDGQPSHSVEAIIWDGPSDNAPDNDVAQAVWDNKAGGVTPFGNTMGSAVDENGDTQTAFFTRANQLNMKMAITVEINKGDPSSYAGDLATKAAIVAEFATRTNLGVIEVRPTHYIGACIKGNLGIVDVTNLQIGNVLIGPFPPNLQNFDIPPRTKALLDTSNITITQVLVSV